MRKLATLVFLLALSLSSVNTGAQVFPVNNLTINGSITNRVNMTILPDGYTLAQMPLFLSDAAATCDTAFDISPFKEYKPFFNVFAVQVPSIDQGTDHPADATDVTEPVIPYLDVNTYFDCTFDGNGTHRALVCGDNQAAYNVLMANVPSSDIIFMLANSAEYGGTGGWIATSSMHPAAPHIAVHEWGHSFAGLADEYWAGSQFAAEHPNMTADNNVNTVKWHDWLGIDNIGIYQHPGEPWYKPHEDCKMEALANPFCNVCRETIISTIYGLVSPIDNALPDTLTTVTYSGTAMNFLVDPVRPNPNTLTFKWVLNGTTLAGVDTFKQILGTQLINGNNTLKAYVTDTTDFSRCYWPAPGYQFSATWKITKTVTGVVQVSRADDSKFFYKLYPVPATKELNIEYDNNTTDKYARYAITDMLGRVVKDGGLNLSLGKQQGSIGIEDLTSGYYILSLKGDNISVDKKFSVNR